MPKVIIITLNYNQNDYTLKCIDSVLQSDYKNFSIILIDNGSTEENFSKLEKQVPEDSRLCLKRLEENRGYVGGINHGLGLGLKEDPDYFLIMNNDTIIDKYAISALTQTCIKYDNKAIVSGKVYHYDEPNKLQDIGYTFKSKKKLTINRLGLNENDNGQFDEVKERDLLDDVFWLFPAQLYKQIGGYSSYFWFNAEQADFALRAKKEGYKLVFTPVAKLWHKGSVSIGGRDKNPKLVYWHIQSTLIFRYRNLPIMFFLHEVGRIIIGIIGTYLKATLLVFKKGKWDFTYSNAKFKALIYFIKWLFIKNKNIGYNPYSE